MVEEIVGHIVLRLQIAAPLIAAHLIHRFEAGRPLVLDLYKVVVAVSRDRDAHFHLVAHLQPIALLTCLRLCVDDDELAPDRQSGGRTRYF